MKNYDEVNVGDSLEYYDCKTDKRYPVEVLHKKKGTKLYLIKCKLSENAEELMFGGCVGVIDASRNKTFKNLY